MYLESGSLETEASSRMFTPDPTPTPYSMTLLSLAVCPCTLVMSGVVDPPLVTSTAICGTLPLAPWMGLYVVWVTYRIASAVCVLPPRYGIPEMALIMSDFVEYRFRKNWLYTPLLNVTTLTCVLSGAICKLFTVLLIKSNCFLKFSGPTVSDESKRKVTSACVSHPKKRKAADSKVSKGRHLSTNIPCM